MPSCSCSLPPSSTSSLGAHITRKQASADPKTELTPDANTTKNQKLDQNYQRGRSEERSRSACAREVGRSNGAIAFRVIAAETRKIGRASKQTLCLKFTGELRNSSSRAGTRRGDALAGAGRSANSEGSPEPIVVQRKAADSAKNRREQMLLLSTASASCKPR